jgi:hypothetical protein
MIQNLRMTRHHLSVMVQIEIAFSNVAQAKTVMNALIPDNVDFPKGLSMKMFPKGSTIEIDLMSKNVPIATVIGTLDELLEHLSLAKKVMQS